MCSSDLWKKWVDEDFDPEVDIEALVNEWSGKLLNKEGQNLFWKKLNDLRGLKILDADVPVINKLITIYG